MVNNIAYKYVLNITYIQIHTRVCITSVHVNTVI